MAVILGLESTCDETAAAVVADGHEVRSNVVASQAELHAKFRGVVPEIASRAHIENILPVIQEAVGAAGLDGIDAVSVAHRPGLVGSLLISVTAAKTLAWMLGKPLIGVDHVHAHLYSVCLDPAPGERAAESAVSSGGAGDFGGHTAVYSVPSFDKVELIGSTIDDAVGEAYDKVAAILGLGYPGGPILDRLAAGGDGKAVEFPRTMLGRESLDFSFSGLKTSVLYHVRGVPRKGHEMAPARELVEPELSNIAASFQAACIDVLVKKLQRAAKRIRAKSIIIGGGVSANRGLRAALAKFPIPVLFPPLKYCTDNAAMSAGLAHLAYERGEFSGLDLDAITFSQFRR